MRQIILLVLLFVVGQWLVKALRRADARTGNGARDPHAPEANGAGQSSSNRTANGARGAPPQLPEPMIRCAECGVHAPKSDSVAAGGEVFCCLEHAQRYAARVQQTKGREGR